MKNIGILTVNFLSCTCSKCDANADPHEEKHEMKDSRDLSGCGARFVAITTEYVGMEEKLRQLRPDLPQVDMPLPATEPVVG